MSTNPLGIGRRIGKRAPHKKNVNASKFRLTSQIGEYTPIRK